MKILLEKAGHYLVLEENDATKAYQNARNFRPDVAEAAAQIDADPELRSTPIIFLTALVTMPEAKHGLRIEGHRSLAKPIDIPELINQIEESLLRAT